MLIDPEMDRFNFLFVNFVFFVADNFKDFFIFGSPINRDFRFAPTGLSGLGVRWGCENCLFLYSLFCSSTGWVQ